MTGHPQSGNCRAGIPMPAAPPVAQISNLRPGRPRTCRRGNPAGSPPRGGCCTIRSTGACHRRICHSKPVRFAHGKLRAPREAWDLSRAKSRESRPRRCASTPDEHVVQLAERAPRDLGPHGCASTPDEHVVQQPLHSHFESGGPFDFPSGTPRGPLVHSERGRRGGVKGAHGKLAAAPQNRLLPGQGFLRNHGPSAVRSPRGRGRRHQVGSVNLPAEGRVP